MNSDVPDRKIFIKTEKVRQIKTKNIWWRSASETVLFFTDKSDKNTIFPQN